jgi:cyclopropane fatty-acyl-phospholipid synthase-like methyltransferase
MVASHYDNGKTRFNEFLKGLDTNECSFYQPSQISFSKSQNQTQVIQAKNIKGRLSSVFYDFHILPD